MRMIGRVSGALPKNADLAAQFDLLADLMEIEGADGFRIGAYRKAAGQIRETPTSVAKLALEGRAKELQGIGKTIEEKIVEVVADGEIHALTKRKAEVPVELATFMRLPGLGPKTARRIWKELGISTVEGLRVAAETEQLRTLDGLGAKVEENILAALAKPRAAEGPKRALLGNTLPKLRAAVATLAAHPAAVEVSLAGSARRFREIAVRDLDIIATASDAPALIAAFCELPWVVEVAARGTTKATVVSQDGLRFDLRVVPPEAYGNLLQHFTGSKAHNVALREAAVRKGLSVSEYGITEVETGNVHSFATEDEVYAFLGYAWIPPELRENLGELDAARRDELPVLVELSDIRGDLHTHTTWSDGKNSLDEMVARAVAKGYEYYAICDHSHRLRDGRLGQQHEAIDELNAQTPLMILKGIEANIRTSGEVDVADEELATLDWVVASVHNSFDKNATERVLAAMENPNVDCIGHLTGRKISRRAPAEIDLERVIEKALETGTFLEINSQPDRLDLSDVHARAAREAGLKLVIDSDGHRLEALDYVELGVGQARRAWLTKAYVLNTHTWKQVERLRKR